LLVDFWLSKAGIHQPVREMRNVIGELFWSEAFLRQSQVIEGCSSTYPEHLAYDLTQEAQSAQWQVPLQSLDF
jgi:hypothetical protein